MARGLRTILWEANIHSPVAPPHWFPVKRRYSSNIDSRRTVVLSGTTRFVPSAGGIVWRQSGSSIYAKPFGWSLRWSVVCMALLMRRWCELEYRNPSKLGQTVVAYVNEQTWPRQEVRHCGIANAGRQNISIKDHGRQKRAYEFRIRPQTGELRNVMFVFTHASL